MNILLPQNRWNGDKPVTISIPEEWKLQISEMDGDALPVLTDAELRAKIDAPIGSPTLDELARGKTSACILFDDMSRGTPTAELAHIVLEKLLAAGIEKERILFLCAVGCHGALELDDFVKKLGADICAEYAVYNHNPFENLTDVGVTSRGFHTMVNAEFMKYDLKIGLGGIVPHAFNGFGGGCKIVLPGITGIDTSVENHKIELTRVLLNRDKPFCDCHGNLQYKGVREDEEEATMLAGLDFKIDVLMNTSCQIVDLFAGHPIKEYYEGVKKAFQVYSANHVDKADVVVVNANAKPNEAQFAVNIGADHVKEGGDVVMVNFCKTGVVNHYLGLSWGIESKARLAAGNKLHSPLPAGMRQLIIFSPYPQYNHAILYGDPKYVKWASTWEEVMGYLGDRGPGTTAAVFRESIMSMFADEFKKEYEPVNINLTKKEH